MLGGGGTMSSVSSINRHRINTYHVNRKNNNLEVAQVDRLQPVNPVQNSSASANDNFVMFSDMFYGKLMDLKSFYKRFYINEQALGDIIRQLKEKGGDSPARDLSQLVKELVEKYNAAFQSLEQFEKEIGLHHSRRLIKTMQKYAVHINRLGITLTGEGLLRVNVLMLDRNLEYHPEYLQVLLQPNHGLLHELNQQFKSVQAHPNQNQFQQITASIAETVSKGSLVDKKT